MNAMSVSCAATARTLGLGRVSFGEPVHGAAKWDAYRAADLFVLPSLNENFGLTVAEALAAGTPVIATTGTPWSRVESEGCGWRVEPACDALAATLATAMAMPRPTLHGMGSKGRAWMARDFSWDRVACDMGELYCMAGRPRRAAAERPAAVTDAPQGLLPTPRAAPGAMLDQITPLILTHNELSNIERTLSKLAWAKRIVVIDSFSTDGTLDILRCDPRVAVFTHEFVDFAGQCNFGLTQIESAWVLSLDADYELSDELLDELRTARSGRDRCRLSRPFRLPHSWTFTARDAISPENNPLSRGARLLSPGRARAPGQRRWRCRAVARRRLS